MAGPSELTLEEAARSFDPAGVRALERSAEDQRQETLRRYPREHWARMSLREYAMGQQDQPDNFCRWIERQTDQFGSIRGGSARKLIVYKHADKPGWYFPRDKYENEQEAWEAVREGFLAAFELANQGRWSEIDEIEALRPGPSLLVKTLWVYFPDELLPITSSEHLRHFLRVAGREDVADQSALGAVQLNRSLLEALRGHAELEGLSTRALERLLYLRFSPMEGRLIKIAPGHDARFWNECLEGGFICVGWDEVGDLTSYESKENFIEAFREEFGEKHPTPGKQTEKANELWTLLEIADGERIVANRGTSEILGIGTVVPPGYVYDDSRPEYKHTIRVDWDTGYAKEIPPQGRWSFKTILPLTGKARELVLGDTGDGENGRPGPEPEAEPVFSEIADSLERKGQGVLYGPPGTGKTWTARRFARWWLRRRMDSGTAGGRGGSDGASGAGDLDDFLEWITFHPSYSYEDFVEGFRPRRDPSGGVALELEDGIFKTLCRRADADRGRAYLLVIDEINRANITKVFGELITLLEKDKRGLEVRLPYSKQPFAIPPNLFVLGTMNTADRSIKLLDTALRRRFGFVELMPDPELLSGSSVEGIALDELLGELNRRIARLAGREKQIGHSFFLNDEQPISDVAQFARVFRAEIVPLLQEYAYDDYEQLVDFLGERIVDREALALNEQILADASLLLEALEEHLIASDDASP